MIPIFFSSILSIALCTSLPCIAMPSNDDDTFSISPSLSLFDNDGEFSDIEFTTADIIREYNRAYYSKNPEKKRDSYRANHRQPTPDEKIILKLLYASVKKTAEYAALQEDRKSYRKKCKEEGKSVCKSLGPNYKKLLYEREKPFHDALRDTDEYQAYERAKREASKKNRSCGDRLSIPSSFILKIVPHNSKFSTTQQMTQYNVKHFVAD